MNTTLTQLQLGGFEVFRELATIPFSAITLLYGPNSAGNRHMAVL